LFKQMTGTDMVHVPYKGSGPAIQDVLAGRVELFITTPPSVIGHIQQGKLRALAVAGKTRHPMLPDVPTAKEQGFDFELDAWVSLFAPAGTPDEAIAKLATALEQGLAAKDVHERAEAAGVAVRFQGPAELGETVAADTDYWARITQSAGMPADWLW